MNDTLTAALPLDERWDCKNMMVTENKIVTFWSRLLKPCISKLYGKVENRDGFIYSGDVAANDNPHGATVWLREETALKQRLGEDACLAGVQLYADATLVSLKGQSVHPVYMCLLNHPYDKKILNIETVAYLPSLGHVDGLEPDSEELRMLKLKLYHASFDVLLNQLREMKDGCVMAGPDGILRMVAPVFLNFIGDNPEVGTVCSVSAVVFNISHMA